MTQPIRSIHQLKGISLDFPEPIAIDAPAPLCVHYLEGRGDRLVVSFAGVGTRRHDVQPPEFIGAASNYGENHVLFISDQSRSWMNSPGLADAIRALIEQYQDFLGITDVVAIGNSMGGFSALVLADLLLVRTVVAVAPQFSMHPDLVPEESRWTYHRDRIKQWYFADVGKLDNDATTYFILHGSHPHEAQHWRRFPKSRYQFVFNGIPHDLAARLRKRKMLTPLVAAACENKPRKVRKLLQKYSFGRRFDVMLRDEYEDKFPHDSPVAARTTESHPQGTKGSEHDHI